MQEESEKARERDAFCTIDKENLCEPRTKHTAIIQQCVLFEWGKRLKT